MENLGVLNDEKDCGYVHAIVATVVNAFGCPCLRNNDTVFESAEGAQVILYGVPAAMDDGPSIVKAF